MIIKPAKRIFNSDKTRRSYSDLNFGVTFFGIQCINIESLMKKRRQNGAKIMQKIIEKKLNVFGLCRISDVRLVKQVLFGVMNETNQRERTRRR